MFCSWYFLYVVQQACPDVKHGEITRGKQAGREIMQAVTAASKSHLPSLPRLGKPAPLQRAPQPELLLWHKVCHEQSEGQNLIFEQSQLY